MVLTHVVVFVDAVVAALRRHEQATRTTTTIPEHASWCSDPLCINSFDEHAHRCRVDPIVCVPAARMAVV